MQLPVENREQAGMALAEAMQDFKGRHDTLVLALPRGGVPVAYEVAKALQAPLDLMLVRKLGVPGQEELAMGAIAAGGFRLLNQEVIRDLSVQRSAVERVEERERHELERRLRAYRGDRPQPPLRHRCTILVDDGVATGATMRVAIAAARYQQPAMVVVAVPFAPVDTAWQLRQEADQLVCLATPDPFIAVGHWYRNFPQVTDDQVRAQLAMSQRSL